MMDDRFEQVVAVSRSNEAKAARPVKSYESMSLILLHAF